MICGGISIPKESIGEIRGIEHQEYGSSERTRPTYMVLFPQMTRVVRVGTYDVVELSLLERIAWAAN